MAMPKVIPVLTAAAFVAACSGSNSSGTVSVSGKGAAITSASSGSPGPSASPQPSPSPGPSASPIQGTVDGTALVVTDGAATLRLERVVLAVRELKLDDGACAKPSPSPSPNPSPNPSPSPSPAPASTALTAVGSGGDSSHEGEHSSGDSHHAECEVELGPKVVSLDGAAFAATTFKLFDATVRPGTYHELKLKVCPFDAKSTVPGAADLAGASIVVVGSYQPAPTAAAPTPAARPFSMAIKTCAELEREVAITVGADGSVPNLTLNLDPARWIVDASGRLVDPSDPAGAAAITARLMAALDVYEDRNHDGHCDD